MSDCNKQKISRKICLVGIVIFIIMFCYHKGSVFPDDAMFFEFWNPESGMFGGVMLGVFIVSFFIGYK